MWSWIEIIFAAIAILVLVLIFFLPIWGIVWDGIIGTFREKWEAAAYDKGFEAGQKFERDKRK